MNRNLNPTPEVVLAMTLWGREYAFEQRGGSMDFWDNLDESRKRLVRDLLARVEKAQAAHRRAAQPDA